MRKALPKPTDAELAILQVLWRNGPSTVKAVQTALGGETGYTTALKLLQIMTEKGLVRRDETDRAHVYEACASEGDTQKQLVSGLLQKAFGGSASKLVLQALSAKRATPEELAEIKRIVQQLSKEAK
jgi:predicted transcriptional regulator